ncbi:hypothetical protein EUGRSUZ_C01717 [Eucalyptus grandis]|uniref:Uncharacterized protein n=2 Tax=Eucalyptus grandis TaxID=71139 RepID=A0ACC3LDK1_EUCGR|nr:hypothetical protein EUGRSUZ_C01717 [Eucalyptus grandis]
MLKTLPEKAQISLKWLRVLEKKIASISTQSQMTLIPQQNHKPTSTCMSSYHESKDFGKSSVAKQHTGLQYDIIYTSDEVGSSHKRKHPNKEKWRA